MGHNLGHTPDNGSAGCITRLDRVRVIAGGWENQGLPRISNCRTVWDTFVHQQTKVRTYLRCRYLVNDVSGTQIYWQYARQHAWLKPWTVTFIADDRRGVKEEDLQSVLRYCGDYYLVLIEIAFDFDHATGINATFVRRHALFGKSRPRIDRGGEGQLRFGGRHSDVLVRAYSKASTRSFRVELELHSSLLRVNQINKVSDIPRSSEVIVPSHFRMAAIDWHSVRRYLIGRHGPSGIRILEGAKSRAGSIHAALSYLRGKNANNVHRFLAPVTDKNDLVRRAAKSWGMTFAGGGL